MSLFLIRQKKNRKEKMLVGIGLLCYKQNGNKLLSFYDNHKMIIQGKSLYLQEKKAI